MKHTCQGFEKERRAQNTFTCSIVLRGARAVTTVGELNALLRGYSGGGDGVCEMSEGRGDADKQENCVPGGGAVKRRQGWLELAGVTCGC